MAGPSKINLIVGSHAHVPSGACKEDFEKTYEERLRPFVCSLYRYPKIQAVLHYSGPLLYWIERNHHEFFLLIDEMAGRKQIEIMGGGFYEPAFPLIPPQDRIDQIEFMTTYLRKHFGKRPSGCWIPAFAWEQQLVGALAASGMSYTFLPDAMFEKAGGPGGPFWPPCLTEDLGKLATVFPVSSFLENELAAKSPMEVFGALKESPGAEIIVSVFPEKLPPPPFGGAAEGAWDGFFEGLCACGPSVDTALPGKLSKSLKGLKKLALAAVAFGGRSPRNFIIEDATAGGIYAKMMFVNVLISQIKGDKARKKSAREELWKAQDSAIFTPSPPGGRDELVKTAYQSLLAAERLSREKGKFDPSLIQHDFDLDGALEYLFQSAKINCYIQLAGASVFELDYLPKAWNYLSCAAGPGGGRQAAFSDMFLPKGFGSANSGALDIEGGLPQGARACFAEQYEVSGKQDRQAPFRLKAAPNIPLGALSLSKCFSIKKDALCVSYEIKNTARADLDFCFASEIIFSFPGKGEDLVRFFAARENEKEPAGKRSLAKVNALSMLDLKNEVKLLLASQIPFDYFITPAHRGAPCAPVSVLPFFEISLKSGECWKNDFSLNFFD